MRKELGSDDLTGVRSPASEWISSDTSWRRRRLHTRDAPNLKTEAEIKIVPPARESNPLPTASTIGAHSSGISGRVVRHATSNRSTVVQIYVEAEVFREDKFGDVLVVL